MGSRVPGLGAPALALALLVACGTGAQPGAPGGGPRDDGVIGTGSDPVGLVGLWRVADAEGEGERTWLRLAAGSYQLWGDCGGFSEGGWRASSRVFVASTPFAAVGACPIDPWPDGEGWLEAARAYRPSADGWELLDADGDVVARLRVDGAPDPIATALPDYARPPEVTSSVRAVFAEPAPLPAPLRAATADDLVGRWAPAGWGLRGPHVVLAADGTYTGSDGCNGASGAWGVDEGGWVLATSGISTMIGCDGAAVPSWLASAARAGFDGATLVLVDAEGAEIARLVRD